MRNSPTKKCVTQFPPSLQPQLSLRGHLHPRKLASGYYIPPRTRLMALMDFLASCYLRVLSALPTETILVKLFYLPLKALITLSTYYQIFNHTKQGNYLHQERLVYLLFFLK